MLLPLKDKIIQVDPVASNGQIICSGEGLEIVHSISAEYNVFQIISDIISYIYLFICWAAHVTPRRAQERLIWCQLAACLVWIRAKRVVLLEIHVEPIVDGVMLDGDRGPVYLLGG